MKRKCIFFFLYICLFYFTEFSIGSVVRRPGIGRGPINTHRAGRIKLEIPTVTTYAIYFGLLWKPFTKHCTIHIAFILLNNIGSVIFWSFCWVFECCSICGCLKICDPSVTLQPRQTFVSLCGRNIR